MSESSEFTLAAMRAGASAYLNKSLPLPEVLSAIDHALTSPLVFSSRDTVKIFDRNQITLGLSQREIQILSQLHLGAPLKDLAASLFIAEATLKTHLASIYRKLEVNNRVQAIEKARIARLT
jgi:DNA-binding NarL/FixJ family response regulator